MSMSFNDKSLDAMRALVVVMDREIALGAPTAQLRDAWARLVTVLALGPAPELRSCPRCNEVGMRAASRCGRCWLVLPPYDAAASA
jgi:hypothetical protein